MGNFTIKTQPPKEAMDTLKQTILALIVSGSMVSSAAALTVTQSTDPTTLGNALQGTGLTIDSVIVNDGNAAQFATYTGFTSPPVTLADGVVISTGQAIQTTAAFHSSSSTPGIVTPSTDLGGGSTPEFDAYAAGRVANWDSAHDVASFTVNFTLPTASDITFNWAFGSVEYPYWTSSYTDAIFGFLDGTDPANQILFDSSGNPVQVGNSFASSVVTDDTNTAFSNPHGLLLLTTTTGSLSAGDHSLTFEIGDTNDGILDSAAFLASISAIASTEGGPVTNPTGTPEPSTGLLLVVGAGSLAILRRRLA
jgi:hypothetical protein